MSSTGWIALAAGVLSCLVVTVRPVPAAPVSQTAAQSQPARTDSHFDLDPSCYSAGVTGGEEYERYLAAQLLDMEARLSGMKDPPSRPAAALELAGFVLTRVVEADLTRVWLLRRPAAKPDRALRALAIARRALFEADQLRQRSGIKVLDPQDAARLQRLRTVLAMETALLSHVDPAEALRAAYRADAFLDQVPQTSRPAWDLLVAACLLEAGKKEDALLRLQLILRRHCGSAPAAAAAMLQAQILADAGSYAAAIALLGEYVQVMPTVGADLTGQQATTAAGNEGVLTTRPADRLVQCTLTLLRADLAGRWADTFGQSTTPLDRQTAVQLREQAARWHAQAEDLGPYLFRSLPVLRTLDPAASE